MIRLFRVIIFILFFLFPETALTQISGTIYYTDGSTVELTGVDVLYLELHYYSTGYYRKKINDPGVYEKTFPLERLNQITFIYEKGNTVHDFFYLLTVKGMKGNNIPFKIKIRTWDWMEISSPETGAKSDMRVVFFYKEKKMKIDRIIFRNT